MHYATSLLIFFTLVASIALFITLVIYVQKKRRVTQAQEATFKDSYRSILQKTPHYNNLSATDREAIERSILLFAYTKQFIGVGLEVTEEMKVIIGFYACLLLLHVEDAHCYENLERIIIYPTAVAIDNISNNGGIYTKEKFVISGQSTSDTVVLIWHEARREAYHLRHNSNVIIHEFAHEIDFLDGEIDGVPPIEKSKYHEWAQVLFGDYEKLTEVALKNRDWGRYKLLGAYAASNEAEFFAVVTERFFESPHALKREFPELYNELKSFYNLDTVTLVKAAPLHKV